MLPVKQSCFVRSWTIRPGIVCGAKGKEEMERGRPRRRNELKKAETKS